MKKLKLVTDRQTERQSDRETERQPDRNKVIQSKR